MIKTRKINNYQVKVFGNGNEKDFKHKDLINNLYPNILLVSRKKSGKSTVAMNLINNMAIKNKTKLNIFSPTILKDKSNIPFIEKFYKTLGEDFVDIYEEFEDVENNNFLKELDNIDERIKNNEDEKSKIAYPFAINVYDDLDLNDLKKSEDLAKFARNNRHYRTINIFSTQSWKNLNPSIRKNADVVILFKGLPLETLKAIYEEVNPDGTLKDFIKVYNFATNKKFNFLFIDVENKEYRKNFDEQIELNKI